VQCRKTSGCGTNILSCQSPIYYGSNSFLVRDRTRLAWAENREVRHTCLNSPDNYNYGAYKWTVQLVTNDNRLEKILFPIFWGLMTLRYLSFLTYSFSISLNSSSLSSSFHLSSSYQPFCASFLSVVTMSLTAELCHELPI